MKEVVQIRTYIHVQVDFLYYLLLLKNAEGVDSSKMRGVLRTKKEGKDGEMMER